MVDWEMGKGREYARISPTPAYFLLTHGIELTLKAYLHYAGLTVEQLGARALGHDLRALYAKACELGLTDLYQLTAEDAEAFDLLVAVNEFHQLRYIQTGAKTFPLWSVAEPFAVRLHQAVAPKVGFGSLTKVYPSATPTPDAAQAATALAAALKD